MSLRSRLDRFEFHILEFTIDALHAPDVSGSPGGWSQVGQPRTCILPAAPLVGLLVNNTGSTGYNTAVFDHLTVEPLNEAPVVTIAPVNSPVAAPLALHGEVSDDGYPGVPALLTSHWSRLSGVGNVLFADAATPETSASFDANGAYQLRLEANDGDITTFKDIAFNAYVSAFARWQSLTLGSTTSAAAQALADPDADGLANLFEYASGTPAALANANPQIVETLAIDGQRYFRLTVPKNPDATDATMEVQVTGDLSNSEAWTSAGLVIEEDTATLLRVRDSIPIGIGGRRFFRVVVRLY